MLGTQRRCVEKPKGGLFHSAWKSRTNREIPTFPQPQQQAFSGYISNGATWVALVTFLDGLTRGGLRLIPTTRLLQALRIDYEKMIADGMFDGEPPTFDWIITRLDKLAKEINAH
jgi:hypothetical protein